MTAAAAPASWEWLRKPFSAGESRLVGLETAIAASLVIVAALGLWDRPWRLLLISAVMMCLASIGQRMGGPSSVDLSIVALVGLANAAVFLNALVLLAWVAPVAVAEILSWAETQSALRRAALSNAIRDSLVRGTGWIAAIIASLAVANRTEQTVLEAAFNTPLEGLALSAGILVGGLLLVAVATAVWAFPRIARSRVAAGTALPLAAGDALWFCVLSGAVGIAVDVRAALSAGVFSEPVGRGCWLALAASFAFFAARLFLPARHDAAAVQPLWILYLGAGGSKRVLRSHAARLATRWPNGPVTIVAEPEMALRWGGAHLRSALLRGRIGALFPLRAIHFADWLDTLPPRERWQSMPVRELYVRSSLWQELFETQLQAEAVIVIIADGEPDETTVDHLRALLPTARTTFHLPTGPQKPAIARWPGVEADAIVGAPAVFIDYWVTRNVRNKEARRLRFVLIEHDANDREFAVRLAEALQGKVDGQGRTIHSDRIDLGHFSTRRVLQRSLLRILSRPGNAALIRFLYRWHRYEDPGNLLILLMNRRGIHEFDLVCVESATRASSIFDARSSRFADRVTAILPAEETPAWRLPVKAYRDVIRRPAGNLQTQVDQLAARYLALRVRTSPEPKAGDRVVLSQLRRATLSDIPEIQRWQINAVWNVEYSRIENYIKEQAYNDVDALMIDAPSQQAGGAKLDGHRISDEVNAVYGATATAIGADVIGRAARGELERNAPSPWTVRLLGVGTFAAFMVQIGRFVTNWWMQNGSLMTVGIGVLFAGFGYLTGEGLGRVLIAAGEDKKENTGALRWLFLITGFIGVAGMTLIRYLAMRGAAGIVGLVLPTVLAVAIAVLHAAHTQRSHKRWSLIAQMFSVQLYFSTQQAQQSYAKNLWTTLYDQAVSASGKSFQTDVPQSREQLLQK